ncbi:hypothetical protein ACFYYN_42240 [Streptomyces sp. NPDC001902]
MSTALYSYAVLLPFAGQDKALRHLRGMADRREIFSPGMSSMPSGFEPRARMWKLSRHTPSAG